MIHIFVGTKAQLIKMMPIIRALDRRGIIYNFINVGQHADLTADLIKQFRLRQPDVAMRQGRKNIDSLAHAILWTIHHLGCLAFNPKRIFHKIFNKQSGVCLIHGDTLTTLISLLYAKRCGLSVAHVEAGLRSFNVLDPFPEEIIRLVTMRFSDLLLAPSTWAFKNLCKMGYHAKTVNIGANTGLETATIVKDRLTRQRRSNNPYAVVTIHRVETIYSRSRLIKVVDIIERMAQERKVFFILHEPTRQQLVRFNLLSKISQNKAIEILSILPYAEFLSLVVGSDYVVTDGGSVQEECYYLDKPCLVLRSKTERIEGLGENVFLSEFDPMQIERFWKLFPTLKRQSINKDLRPSDIIIDHVLAWD